MSDDQERTPGGAPGWEPAQVPPPGGGSATATDEETQELAPRDTASAADTHPGAGATRHGDDTVVMGAAGAGAGLARSAYPTEPGPRDEPVADGRGGPPVVMIVLLVLALLLGGAGLGVGIYAAHKTAQPGQTGAQGTTGSTGPAGPTGPKGAPGPAGLAGTVVNPTVVPGSVVSTGAAAGAGTSLSASATCPSPRVLLSGGAQVTAPGATKDVALQSSYPTDATTWQTTAVVLTTLPAGDVMTMKPFVLCGSEPAKTTPSV